ncbi:SpaA isopeptide-forming pilin-related protein, partial [uncultured Clostridium sp.]|uniref:MSCRAMM family protein n=1 Tax=uncultured Clostridium sp. TaxID=59620 RepID=UPI0025D2252A
SFELGYGKYFYQEFEAPKGYVIDEKLYPFEIKNNGEIVKAQMKNEKIAGKLEITKTDVADGKLLANAGFRIYDENKNVIKEGRTNDNGIASFELGYGKYFYQEFEAPNGYIIDEKLYPFEIKNNGEIVKVQMKNEKIVDSSEPSEPIDQGEPSEPIDQGEPSEPIDQSELIESIESSESSIVIEAKNINEPIEQSKSNTPSYNDSSTSNTNTLPNTGGVNSRIYIAVAILITIIGVRFLRSSKYRLDN